MKKIINQAIENKYNKTLIFPVLIVLMATITFFLPSSRDRAGGSTFTIKAVGDVVPGSNFMKIAMPQNPRKAFFGEVEGLLKGADLLFGNFESTLTDYPKTRKDTSRKMVFAFRSPPAYASILKEVGFDVMSVANNHSLDFFDAGYKDTIHNLEKGGIRPTGQKGVITYTTINNTKLAFIGYSYLGYHNSMHDIEAMKKLINEASRNAEIVVVSVHAGAEGSSAIHTKNETEKFYSENRGNIVRFAHHAIDYGADLVIGHGPHVPRAIELYKERLIAYSLGNFLGYKVFSTSGYKGWSLVLQTSLDTDGRFIEGEIIPLQLDQAGIPHPDSEKKSIGLIRQLTREDFPDTNLTISASGRITRKETK